MIVVPTTNNRNGAGLSNRIAVNEISTAHIQNKLCNKTLFCADGSLFCKSILERSIENPAAKLGI